MRIRRTLCVSLPAKKGHAMKSPSLRKKLKLCVAFAVLFSAPGYGHDLLGSDIAALDVQNAQQCADACAGNAGCAAWTFVRAGLKGPSARCFLKNPVPQPSFNAPCLTNFDCVSGYAMPKWCGNKLQGDVLACPVGACAPKRTKSCSGWWIFRSCTTLVSTDYFCP